MDCGTDIKIVPPSGSKKWRVRWKDSRGKWTERTAQDRSDAEVIAEGVRTGELVARSTPRRRPTVFERGTRIYPPRGTKASWRIRYKDPTTGQWAERTARSEQQALEIARTVEDYATNNRSIREGERTLAVLVDSYLESISHLSVRYQERQAGLLRGWVVPDAGETEILAWTTGVSKRLLNKAGGRLGSERLHDLRAALRQLANHAVEQGWVPRGFDPLHRVTLKHKVAEQGKDANFIPRDSLPTASDVEKQLLALEEVATPAWSLAVELDSFSGLRWGELIALRPVDLLFRPHRIVSVTRAYQQDDAGCLGLALPKHNKIRESLFPKSLADRLERYATAVKETEGPTALLFPGPDGGPAARQWFRRRWIRAAQLAGWDMASTRDPQWPTPVWSPHDVRHFAACWMLFDVKLDVALVSHYLGHFSPAFTMARYIGYRGDPREIGTQATDDW